MFKKISSMFKNAWRKHIVQEMPPAVEVKERELKSHSPFRDMQIHPTQGILARMMHGRSGTSSKTSSRGTRKTRGNRHRSGMGGGTYQPFRKVTRPPKLG